MCCFNEYSLPALSCLFPSITVSKLCAKNKINWGGSNYVRSSGRSPQEDWPRAERIRERGRNATSSTFNIYLSILVFPGYYLLVFLFQFKLVKFIIVREIMRGEKNKKKKIVSTL